MTQRTERAGYYKEKRKIGKYETTLEDAFKQKKVYTASGVASDTSTLTYVPDTVIITDGTNATTAIVLPLGYFDEDKQVTVVNKDAAEVVTVGGVSIPAVSVAKIYFNGSAWALLYSYAPTTLA
mgnify:CR=1 FL=1